jgi:hypothetical protein
MRSQRTDPQERELTVVKRANVQDTCEYVAVSRDRVSLTVRVRRAQVSREAIFELQRLTPRGSSRDKYGPVAFFSQVLFVQGHT